MCAIKFYRNELGSNLELSDLLEVSAEQFDLYSYKKK